jgi:hypothetical protein
VIDLDRAARVRDRRRRPGVSALALLGLLGALVCASCATVPPPRPRATLALSCNVPDASVWIDDVFMGTVSNWGKGAPMPIGFHRIEIRHPAHFSFFAEVNPREGEVVRLHPILHPQLD